MRYRMQRISCDGKFFLPIKKKNVSLQNNLCVINPSKMKKILLFLGVVSMILVASCTKDGVDTINGDSWYKSRVKGVDSVYKDSTVVTYSFSTDKEGLRKWENIHTIYATGNMTADSVKDTVSTLSFTYTFSNGTGVVYFVNGDVKEFNVRDDKLIIQGYTFTNKKQ